MDRETSTKHGVLERMLLDASAEPTDLPLSLLEDITNDFSDDQRIGSGGFAVVYKGKLGVGMVAMKKLSKTFDIHESKFNEEVSCLMKAKHKNVVRFLGYCSDTRGLMVDYEGMFVMADVRQRLLCFEYLPRGSLDNYITGGSCVLEWGTRYQIIKGICEGLHYLHMKRRIVHLDLKPQNILLDTDMVPKIADFGLSRCFSENQSRIFTSKLMGTLGYLAPERFSGEITFKLDIYSLGVIITEILTGEKGYRDVENVLDIWRNRLQNSQGDIRLEQVRVCAEIGIECTENNPAKRPVTQDIIDRLDETEKDSSELYQFKPSKEPGETSSGVLDISWNRLEELQGGIQLEQVTVCAETRTEHNSTKRLFTQHVTDSLDETESLGWSIYTSVGEEVMDDVKFRFSIEHADQDSFEVEHADQDSFELRQCTHEVPTESGSYKLQPGAFWNLLKELCGGPTSQSQPVTRGSLVQDYELGAHLGRGTFGTVYLARNFQTGECFAIKIIDKDQVTRIGLTAQIGREVSIVRMIRHPNVVRLFEVMATKSKIYFVFECAKAGELFDRISKKTLSENVARMYFHQLISAVDYCHSRGVYHGDLKPRNLLLDHLENLKVSGFGLSSISGSGPKRQDGLLLTTSETPAYVAPEVLNRRGYDGMKADIWSCGVILFVLAAGYLPFHDTDLAEMCRMVSKADYRCPPSFSSELKDLLYKILDPDVSTRVSISRIKMSAWYRKSTEHDCATGQYFYWSGLTTSQEYGVFNAFDIISLSAAFDLSSLFVERYDRREERFTTRQPAETIFAKLNEVAKRLKLKIEGTNCCFILEALEQGLKGFLGIRVEVFEIAPPVFLVELQRLGGDAVGYKQLMKDEIRPALKDIVWAWFPPAV